MKKKQWLSVLLCFALVLSLLPTTAFAVGSEPAAETTCTQSGDCQVELHTEGCPAALPVVTSEPPESTPETTDAFTGPEDLTVGVNYLDCDSNGENWTTKNASCTEVTSTMTTWGTADTESWYVVTVDIMISSRVTVNGTVHLILENGCHLNAANGITVNSGNALTIYSQSTEETTMGQLSATGTQSYFDYPAGIGGSSGQSSGSITINGGKITAIGGLRAAGIGGGNSGSGGTITINGGIVNAEGGYADNGGPGAAGIGGGNSGSGGTITINGGMVTAKGSDARWGHGGAGIGGGGNGAGGSIVISGGTVEAVGGIGEYSNASGIGGGSSGASGSFSTGENGKAIVVANAIADTSQQSSWKGIFFQGNEGKMYGDVILTENAAVPADKLLIITEGQTLTISDGVTLTNNGIIFVNSGANLINNGIISGNAVLYVRSVNYINENNAEAEQECINIAFQTTWDSGWYVVDDDVTISDRITVSGDVHLILVDGKTLTASRGINVTDSNSLSIYAQSTGAEMGTLVSTGKDGNAGIGGNNTDDGGIVTINGGNITTKGETDGAGIGGGNKGGGGTVTINGGNVKAQGGSWAAGIGGGGGSCSPGANVTINGGSVEAIAGTRTDGPAIGLGNSGGGSSTNYGSLKLGAPGSPKMWYVKAGSNASNATDINGSPFTTEQNDIINDVKGQKYVKIYNAVPPVAYLDASGTGNVCNDYTVLTNQTTLNAGWYVVNSNVAINSSRITVSGDVHLILADGTTLDSVGINVDSGNSLTIYAQSMGSNMGKLVATTTTGQEAGITCGGTLTINGGDITATGCNYGAGIGGGQYGNGGTVIINGGTVEATAGNDCSNAIGAGISGSSNGSLKLGTPGNLKVWYVQGGANSSDAVDVSGSPFAAAQENIVTNVSGKKYVRIYQIAVPVPYIDVSGANQSCDEYTVLTDQITLTSGWYVVNSDVTINDRITVSGDVHLILADGCILNAPQGIGVNDGNTLTIYRQENHTGALTAGNPTDGGAAIGANRGTKAGTVIINGGIITASVTDQGGACIGQGGWSGGAGTITINGGHLILSSSVGDEGAFGPSTARTINGGIIEYTSGRNNDTISDSTMNNCIVFNKSNTGTVYGNPTIDFNYTLASGKSITVGSGQTLTVATGATLTNQGSIYVDGTLTGTVSGNIYYPLTVEKGTADPTTTHDGKTYGLSGDTITLTAEGKVGQSASWKLDGVTLSGNTFTMPSKAVTVTAEYVNVPTYTVTIPASVEVGNTATVSATGVNVAEGYTLAVTIDNTSFTMTSGEGATLDYAVQDNGTGTLLHAGDNILTIAGGTENDIAEAALAFTLASGEVEKYSGVYNGTITFHVSINATP